MFIVFLLDSMISIVFHRVVSDGQKVRFLIPSESERALSFTTAIEKETNRKKEKEEYRFWSYGG